MKTRYEVYWTEYALGTYGEEHAYERRLSFETLAGAETVQHTLQGLAHVRNVRIETMEKSDETH